MECIDFDNSQFYVFSGTAYYNFTFPKQVIDTSFFFTTHGITNNQTNDTVSTNHGGAPFKYEITEFMKIV